MAFDEHSIRGQKDRLRQQAAQRRSALSKKDAQSFSAKIRARVLALPEIQAAKTVSIYCSFGAEVETQGLIEALVKAGKKVCLPVADNTQASMTMYWFQGFEALKVTPFGFPEPVPATHQAAAPEAIGVVITPGLAFDEKGHRLGFGMAYYDRYLRAMPKKVPVLSLAFECQLFPEVPVTDRDVTVDKIVTEKRVIATASTGPGF